MLTRRLDLVEKKIMQWFGLLGCLTAMSWGIQLLWMIRKKLK